MYQTITVIQKSSGFLKWEPFSSNSERYIVELLENSITKHSLETLDVFNEWKSQYLSFEICRVA